MELSSKRDPFWDIIKGIAILLVLLGHSIQCSCSFGAESCYDNPLYRFIYSFHMPLFMIICGYFFYGTMRHYNTRQIIQKKVLSLGVPIVVFGLISFPIYFSGPISINNVVHHLLTSMTLLWFLCQIILCSATVLLINRLIGDRYIVYCLLCAFSMLVPNVAGMERYSFMLPMFVLGYYLNKTGLMERILGPRKVTICIIGGFVFIALLHFYGRESFIYTSKTYLWGGENPPWKQLGINIYRVLIGIVGSIFIMTLVRVVIDKLHFAENKSFLAFCGRLSLGIYCFQSFFWHFYPLMPGVDSMVAKCFPFSVVLGFVVSLLLCVFLSWSSSKNKYTSLLFLGSRR